MNLPGVSSISMKCSSSGTESSSGSSNSPIRHWRKGTLRGKVVIIQYTYFLVTTHYFFFRRVYSQLRCFTTARVLLLSCRPCSQGYSWEKVSLGSSKQIPIGTFSL